MEKGKKKKTGFRSISSNLFKKLKIKPKTDHQLPICEQESCKSADTKPTFVHYGTVSPRPGPRRPPAWNQVRKSSTQASLYLSPAARRQFESHQGEKRTYRQNIQESDEQSFGSKISLADTSSTEWMPVRWNTKPGRQGQWTSGCSPQLNPGSKDGYNTKQDDTYSHLSRVPPGEQRQASGSGMIHSFGEMDFYSSEDGMTALTDYEGHDLSFEEDSTCVKETHFRTINEDFPYVDESDEVQSFSENAFITSTPNLKKISSRIKLADGKHEYVEDSYDPSSAAMSTSISSEKESSSMNQNFETEYASEEIATLKIRSHESLLKDTNNQVISNSGAPVESFEEGHSCNPQIHNDSSKQNEGQSEASFKSPLSCVEDKSGEAERDVENDSLSSGGEEIKILSDKASTRLVGDGKAPDQKHDRQEIESAEHVYMAEEDFGASSQIPDVKSYCVEPVANSRDIEISENITSNAQIDYSGYDNVNLNTDLHEKNVEIEYFTATPGSDINPYTQNTLLLSKQVSYYPSPNNRQINGLNNKPRGLSAAKYFHSEDNLLSTKGIIRQRHGDLFTPGKHLMSGQSDRSLNESHIYMSPTAAITARPQVIESLREWSDYGRSSGIGPGPFSRKARSLDDLLGCGPGYQSPWLKGVTVECPPLLKNKNKNQLRRLKDGFMRMFRKGSKGVAPTSSEPSEIEAEWMEEIQRRSLNRMSHGRYHSLDRGGPSMTESQVSQSGNHYYNFTRQSSCEQPCLNPTGSVMDSNTHSVSIEQGLQYNKPVTEGQHKTKPQPQNCPSGESACQALHYKSSGLRLSHDSGFDQLTPRSEVTEMSEVIEEGHATCSVVPDIAAYHCGMLEDSPTTSTDPENHLPIGDDHSARFHRQRLSSENLLDRCQSIDSLSSDDGSSAHYTRSRSQGRFSSHRDLGHRRRRSSGSGGRRNNNIHMNAKTRSWHDVSYNASRQRNLSPADYDTSSESCYYGVPGAMPSVSRVVPCTSPEGSTLPREHHGKRLRKSRSEDVLTQGGATCQCEHAEGFKPYLVSMAASAAYIPGASLSDKLRLAASKGHVDKVHELINAGATFQPDREGRTALHYAALNGQAEIVQILADEGSDVNSQDSLGYTALHRAAAQGHLEVIKVLLSEACVLDRQDQVHGNSPLHEASWNGYSKTLELLIRHKASVHLVNKAGFSALHLAAQNGHNQSARVLLYAGCNADLKNNYGDSPLHTAARYGHAGVTRILISAHCNISLQNKNGDTALHISAALKRRKLSKLLTESGINTSVKNKQNETAVDVARRKEHPEIIVIITSQAKNKKKKKAGKEKKSKENKDEEKTEKKGLFSKKKSKQKDKENEAKSPEPHTAPSEVSSSDLNSRMAPEDVFRGFRHPQQGESEYGVAARGTSTRGTATAATNLKDIRTKSMKKGLLTDYAQKRGTLYYKDLAGNVKQGPIGYTPVCNCQPVLKKLEKKMEADRNNIYDHIDATHKTLTTRIDTLDKRSAQQAFSTDKLTQERIEKERKDREEYIHSCLSKERLEIEGNCEHRHQAVKTELQGHLDQRFTNYERYNHAVAHNCDKENCYWCYHNEQYNEPKYHTDDMWNQNYMAYDPVEPPPPGRLYKSKSDETISVSSSHPSRRHWKLKSTAQKERELIDLKLAKVHQEARRLERKLRSRSLGVRPRATSTEHVNKPRESSVPVPRHSGRTPEGDSGSNTHCEYQSYNDFVKQQHRRVPTGVQQRPDPQHQEYTTRTLPRASSQQINSQRQRQPTETQTNQHHNDFHQNHRLPQATQPAEPIYGRSNQHYNSEMQQRTRSSSATRLPENHRSNSAPRTYDPHDPRPRLGSLDRPPSQMDIRQTASTYNLSSQQRSGNFPQSASYDSNLRQNPNRHYPSQQEIPHQHAPPKSHQPQFRPQPQSQQHQVQIHSQPGPRSAPQKSLPTGGPSPKSSDDPGRLSLPPPQQRVAPAGFQTPASSNPRWQPLHTSSPDVPTKPGQYPSPNTSNSLVSSPGSTPLYPSPGGPNTTPIYPSPGVTSNGPQYPSPTVSNGQLASTNARSESSSNPDSGYGSRLYGGRQISAQRLPSNSSSFQSNEHNSSLQSTNTFQSHEHNSSMSTNTSYNEGSPLVNYNKEPSARRPLNNEAQTRTVDASQQQRSAPVGSFTHQRAPQMVNSQHKAQQSSNMPPQMSAPQAVSSSRQQPQGTQPSQNAQPQRYSNQPSAQQQTRYTSVPGMVSRWYESKVKDNNVRPQENRMWSTSRNNSQPESQGQSQGQTQRYNPGPIIGKATQV